MKKSCIEILAAEPSTICAGGKLKLSANCSHTKDEILNSSHLFASSVEKKRGQEREGGKRRRNGEINLLLGKKRE